MDTTQHQRSHSTGLYTCPDRDCYLYLKITIKTYDEEDPLEKLRGLYCLL